MSGRSRAGRFQPTHVMQISPADAERLQIGDGDEVRVVSRHGEITIGAPISNRVSPGELFTRFQSPALLVNRRTSRSRDRFVQIPEDKMTAVRVERFA